jgi:hypothetical protein
MRSHWWVSRDAQRLLSRCEFSTRKVIDTTECLTRGGRVTPAALEGESRRGS